MIKENITYNKTNKFKEVKNMHRHSFYRQLGKHQSKRMRSPLSPPPFPLMPKPKPMFSSELNHLQCEVCPLCRRRYDTDTTNTLHQANQFNDQLNQSQFNHAHPTTQSTNSIPANQSPTNSQPEPAERHES